MEELDILLAETGGGARGPGNGVGRPIRIDHGCDGVVAVSCLTKLIQDRIGQGPTSIQTPAAGFAPIDRIFDGADQIGVGELEAVIEVGLLGTRLARP